MDKNAIDDTETISTEEVASRAQHFIDQIIVERNKTTMVLNSAKEGHNQIVFDFNERAELKQLLLSVFENGKPFDFQIVEKLGKGQCKINAVRRVAGFAA
jgi:hypothetical protein